MKKKARKKAKKGLRISESVKVWARADETKKGAPDRSAIFAPAQHPPGVAPSEALMANDESGLNLPGEWAAGVLSSFVTEGLMFLGYPYLAELAQRSEYRRGTETLATDMTRNWVKFKGVGDADKTEKIKELTDAVKDKYHLPDVFKKQIEQDGFFGRGHVYVDLGTTDDREELRTPIGAATVDDATSKAKVSKARPVVAFRPVEAVWTYPTSYDSNDPLKPNWYRPEEWYVMGKQVHRTRLLTLVMREVPDLLKPAYSFGGLSLSQMAKPYVDNWLKTRQAVSDLVQSFSIIVLSTQLETLLAPGAGDASLQERVSLFNMLRNNKGVFLLNKDAEDLTNVSTPLGSLDALQSQAQEHMASVWGIPIVKLFGIQPSGLNASSDGELETYDDWIHASQEAFLRIPITTAVGFVQLSLWGAIDPDITYDFEPLGELDETAKAAIRKQDADTGAVLIQNGVIDPAEERKRVANDPDTPYAGLDPDDVPEPPEEPGDEDADPGAEQDADGHSALGKAVGIMRANHRNAPAEAAD